ncbi:Protein of unknown function (DUF1759) [Popillia japonica]|uniref:Uncharacterized protein n=1 Tax=Popillia japonica TaxID=7064 RepID=A0AAW1IFS1_POPJA
MQENAEALKKLVNGAKKHVKALKALNRPVEYWDDWPVCIITDKLDSTSRKHWKATLQTTEIPTYNKKTICNVTKVDPLQSMLQKFWEFEECNQKQNHTAEDHTCEDHFIATHKRNQDATHKRNQDGRFIVKLPFKDNPCMLGESRNIAVKRFQILEQKFIKQPNLKQEYVQFMQELGI